MLPVATSVAAVLSGNVYQDMTYMHEKNVRSSSGYISGGCRGGGYSYSDG